MWCGLMFHHNANYIDFLRCESPHQMGLGGIAWQGIVVLCVVCVAEKA